MIDAVSIATIGGIIIYKRSFGTSSLRLNDAISTVLTNPTTKSSVKNNQTLHWKQSLKTIVVCQSVVDFPWIPSLLELLSCAVDQLPCDAFGIINTSEFDPIFNLILKESVIIAAPKSSGPRPFKESEKYLKSLKGTQSKPEIVPEQTVVERLVKLKQRGKKDGRSWVNGVPSTNAPGRLDYSLSQVEIKPSLSVNHALMGSSMGDTIGGFYDALEIKSLSKPSKSIFSVFTNMLQGIPLTSQKLAPILSKMNEHLISKNVAAETSAHLCKLVSDALLNKKLGPLDSIDTLVRSEMYKALLRVLMPESSVNILNDISKKNGPYSIVFVGVNGVGKSTNLSKLCFWLLKNNQSVLIAACDTFRSGAVEQLKVHVRNLSSVEGAKVELFDAGYGKDPAMIAKQALEYGRSQGFNVVLIDTAGRMQNNTPLMRALSKLITMTQPDKIIFVGEALVGNEALNQLGKFNIAISDFSELATPRVIDGIILSKFDTVDDKVGAAVSMAHVTGKPILFVGTGQTYTDLKKLNVESLVDMLLK